MLELYCGEISGDHRGSECKLASLSHSLKNQNGVEELPNRGEAMSKWTPSIFWVKCEHMGSTCWCFEQVVGRFS